MTTRRRIARTLRTLATKIDPPTETTIHFKIAAHNALTDEVIRELARRQRMNGGRNFFA